VSTLPEPTPTTDLAEIVELEEETNAYVRASRSENTLRAYRADWRQFTAWCDQRALAALPAEASTVALYLTASSRSAKTSTLRRRLSSIAVAHRSAGHRSPTEYQLVRATWAGIRRTHGVAEHGKEAALTEDIRSMIANVPATLVGCRDGCLLLLGFASAMRRSELVGLDVDDVRETPDGLVVRIRRSKTDQTGEGREIGIPYGSTPTTCPVRSYRAWVDVSGIERGPIFRPVDRHGNLGTTRLSDRAVALIVKRAAAAAGLDPGRYAGHSLRSGMATSAARAGASEAQIMAQTGHRNLPVLRRYIRRGSLFNDNAAAKLGL
jgi:site-specific recombinase XerD